MTHTQMTDQQVIGSVAGALINTELSLAIEKADELAISTGMNISVIRLTDGSLETVNDFQRTVRAREIIETVYDSDCGFVYFLVA